MKCQQCDKPATFHITELTGGKPQELHLCEDHARQYLTHVGAASRPAPAAWPRRWRSRWPSRWPIGQTAEELAQLDQQACPVCGITFYEFRSQGRLGCPHDYVVLPDAVGAADREHPRRDGARGQAAAAARRRQRETHRS